MTSALIQTQPAKPSKLLREQQKFLKLQKEIKRLQTKEEDLLRDLDVALGFYHQLIYPIEEQIAGLLMERARIAFNFLRKKKLSPQENPSLQELIAYDLNEIFDILPLSGIPQEFRAMYETIYGIDYASSAKKQLNIMKTDLEELLREEGIHVDFSELNIEDQEEVLTQKMFTSIFEALKESEETAHNKQKTNSQLKQELREQQIEEAQKKSLNSIYRQLAKAFHPDLESNPERKVDKETLMKKVTIAYEEMDLHSLLAIEQEWMKGLNQDAAARSDQQLKIYNEILKDQVAELKMRIALLWDSPKYLRLHQLYPRSFSGLSVLQKKHRALCSQREALSEFVKILKTSVGDQVLLQIIQNKSHAYI